MSQPKAVHKDKNYTVVWNPLSITLGHCNFWLSLLLSDSL